ANVFVGVLLAGIVDENVEPAQLVDRLADGSLAELLVADVAGDRDRLAPLLLDNLPGPGGVVMFAQVKDGDVGAFTGEQRRDRSADAAVGAGDERHLVLQSPGA